MDVRFAARSSAAPHRGGRNDDAWCTLEGERLFAVADGFAPRFWWPEGAPARIAIDALSRSWRARTTLAPEERLIAGVEDASREIYSFARDKGLLQAKRSPIGSTIAVCHVSAFGVHIANVGNSRIYRMRGGELTRLTRDHTLVEDAPPSRSSASVEPERVLTRYLGSNDKPLRVDVSTHGARALDVYLLCTDGFIEAIAEREIVSVCRGVVPAAAADRLMGIVKAAASDDVTLVLLELHDVR